MMRRHAVVLVATLVLLPSAIAGNARLELRARDAVTGDRVDVGFTVEGGTTGLRDERSGVTASVVSGSAIRVTASGPDVIPLATSFILEEGATLPVTFWLDRIVLPEPSPSGALLEVHVHDAGTLAPLEGARVLVVGTSPEGVADVRGTVRIPMTDDDASAVAARPRLATVVIQSEGHETLRIEGIVLGAGTVRLVEDLEAGSGERVKDVTPLALRPHGGGDDHQTSRSHAAAAEALALELALAAGEVPAPADARLVGMAPPPSIKVGTSCSCTTCTGVSVMSLETYVESGIDDEWIASWSGHSLRAGSIPYRAYGAWHVANPISGSYDICSTPCCQAWEGDTYAATVAAGNATAGIMLERGGSLLRSEYSAENNSIDDAGCSNGDLSCGDGYAGSPATGWSCLADAPCAGDVCYGHGRGECQWGTQRWANGQGQLWNWISDHYYNDHGSGTGNRTAAMTSPITMPAFTPNPATVEPGQSFAIDITADSTTSLPHTEIMIGASLYSAGTGYISDPANDTKVTVPPGSSSASRPFVVPASTPPGVYDLYVSLYVDTDGDGAIASTDLPLLLSLATGAVTVGQSCGAIQLDPPSLPPGTVGVAYTQTVTATGGTAPYGFDLASGSLPPGLTLAPTGTISGTPAAAGSFPFVVRATDQGGCTGSRAYTIDVADPGIPAANIAAGMGLGSPNANRVRAFRNGGSSTGVDFLAYAAGQWGANVASGRIDATPTAELLTGPGPGNVFGPQVRAFDRAGAPLGKVNFFAYGTLRFGVNVAAGGVDGDGWDEILTGAGPGSVFGPHVRGFDLDAATLRPIAKLSFFAYQTLRYGVNPGAGGVDGDPFEELLTAPGPGVIFGPQVRGFDHDGASPSAIPGINFLAFTIPQYGARVSGGNVDGDAYSEILAAPGPGPALRATVKGFGFDGGPLVALPGCEGTFGTTFYGGRIGSGDVAGVGSDAILAALGPDPNAPAMIYPVQYDGSGLPPLTAFDAFPGARYGVNPAGAELAY